MKEIQKSKKSNKLILGIVVILDFIVIGSIGRFNNEVKALIKEVQVYSNNVEISKVEDYSIKIGLDTFRIEFDEISQYDVKRKENIVMYEFT